MQNKLWTVAFTATLMAWSVIAVAQTTPGTPASPGVGTGPAQGGDTNWLWIILVLAVLGAAAWYFLRGRGRKTGL